jgi:hypothetical protein
MWWCVELTAELSRAQNANKTAELQINELKSPLRLFSLPLPFPASHALFAFAERR